MQNRPEELLRPVFFIRHYISKGCAPRDMLDRNTATDYNKLDKLRKIEFLGTSRQSE